MEAKFYVVVAAENGCNPEEPEAVFTDKAAAIKAGVAFGCDAVYEVVNFNSMKRINLDPYHAAADRKAKAAKKPKAKKA